MDSSRSRVNARFDGIFVLESAPDDEKNTVLNAGTNTLSCLHFNPIHRLTWHDPRRGKDILTATWSTILLQEYLGRKHIVVGQSPLRQHRLGRHTRLDSRCLATAFRRGADHQEASGHERQEIAENVENPKKSGSGELHPGKITVLFLPTAPRCVGARTGIAEAAATEVEAVDREARFPRKAIDAARGQKLWAPRSRSSSAETAHRYPGDRHVLRARPRLRVGRMIFAMHRTKVACLVRHGAGGGWHKG